MRVSTGVVLLLALCGQAVAEEPAVFVGGEATGWRDLRFEEFVNAAQGR